VHCAVALERTLPPWKLDRKESTKLSLGAVTPTWIGAALGLEGALTSGRGGGSPRPERFVS
jgi:hypothetical protein